MGYLFFNVERFLWILWILCEIHSLLAMIIFSRKDRKDRRDLLPFVFHAGAGVVANFVTTRVRREFYPPPPPCGGCPHVAMGIATLIGHRMTSSHSSKDPLRPPVSGGETDPSLTGRDGVGPVGPWVGPFSEKPLHPSLPGAGRKILVSSRLGPRMESAVNMNEQAHDNMSASHGRCENGKDNEKT